MNAPVVQVSVANTVAIIEHITFEVGNGIACLSATDVTAQTLKAFQGKGRSLKD